MANRTLLKLEIGSKRLEFRSSDLKAAESRLKDGLLFPFFCLVAMAGFVLKKLPLRKRKTKVVILAMGGLGDHLFCLPLLREFKQQYPDVSITVVTESSGIKQWNELISRVFLWRKNSPMPEFLSERFPLWAAFRRMPRLAVRILWNRFDFAITIGVGPYNAAYGALVFSLAGAKKRLGSFQVPEKFHPYLSVKPSEPMAGENIRDVYLRIFPGRPWRDESWKAYLTVEKSWAEKFFLEKGITPGIPKVVIHAGGKDGVNLRRLEPLKYYEIAKRVIDDFGGHVILTGSEDEEILCNQVRMNLGERVSNLAGKVTFTQMLGILAAADLVISNDTSVLHFADGVNAKKMVAVFGPTNPDFVAPQSRRCRVVKPEAACAPCVVFDASDPKTRCREEKLYHCLLDMPVERVWREVLESLYELGFQEKTLVRS